MKIKLQINTPMKDKKSGDIIVLDAFSTGIPKDKFWRRRMNDSERDGCVELVQDKKSDIKQDAENKSTLKTLK